ncbi:MAG: DNA polymerase I [bacterium]
MGKNLYIIDGHSLVYRAYWATARQRLASSKGVPTGATFNFTKMLLKLLREEPIDAIAVVFDPGKPTWRHEISHEYKSTRTSAPDDLAIQLAYIEEIVRALRITILRGEDEADDVIGTLAKRAEAQGYDVYIVSGDKDLMQVVDDHIKVLDTKGGERVVYGPGEVKEKYGVPPENMVDYLALVGDSSDNIKGAEGVGDKTAVKLLQEYGSLENVLKNVDLIQNKRAQEGLKAFGERADLTRRLVTLKLDVPIDVNIEDCKLRNPDRSKLIEIFKELDFASLLEEMGEEIAPERREGGRYKTILEEDDFKNLLETLKDAPELTIDLETTSLNVFEAEIVGIAICPKPREAYYIPVGHRYLGCPKQMDRQFVLESLKPILEDPKIKKQNQNIKYDAEVLRLNGIDLRGIDFDPMVASYLLEPEERHNIGDMAQRYLGFKKTPIKELIGSGRKQISMAEVEIERVAPYTCEDVETARRLVDFFREKLEEQDYLIKLFRDVEMPLVEVLIDMELTGVKIDSDKLKQMSREFSEKLDSLAEKIYDEAGERFNINSTQQLGVILFEKKKMPRGKRMKTGWSTSAEVLESLAREYELPRLVMEYRQLSKLKSTYIDALPSLINPRTGRIHTSYNQTVVATGRISSSNPNLQNIPIRTEEGSAIRGAFVGEGENLILSADYSQIELRILAHLSGDLRLIEAFRRDEDIHSRTAADLFNVDIRDVTPEMRRVAKTVNFGVNYGMSAFGLASRLNIDKGDAQKYIENYFSKYEGVRQYLNETLRKARENGYVETILGRRRYIPDINNKNYQMRSFAERTAINAPIQGSSADMIKVAMVNIHRRIKDNPKIKMIMQVHDELIFEVAPDFVDEAKRQIVPQMRDAVKLNVPVRVDVGVGKNWLDAH